MAVEIKKDTHLVLKIEDIKGLPESYKKKLAHIVELLNYTRKKKGKKLNNKYYICNQDEPYAEKVLAVILKGEGEK